MLFNRLAKIEKKSVRVQNSWYNVKPEEFENTSFSFARVYVCVDEKHFENGALRLSLPEFIQIATGVCHVIKFLRVSVDGKRLLRFQWENTSFKFVRCNATDFYKTIRFSLRLFVT